MIKQEKINIQFSQLDWHKIKVKFRITLIKQMEPLVLNVEHFRIFIILAACSVGWVLLSTMENLMAIDLIVLDLRDDRRTQKTFGELK